MLSLYYTCKTHSEKKKSDFWLPEAGGEGGGNQMEVVKSCKLPVIRQISTREVMYKMTNIINTAVHYI